MDTKFKVGEGTFHYKGKAMESLGFLQAMPWLSKHYPGLVKFTVGERIKLSSLTIEKAKVIVVNIIDTTTSIIDRK